MSKFDRKWNLTLDIDKERFKKVFAENVNANYMRFKTVPIGINRNFKKDFSGVIRNETFTVYKTKGIFDFNNAGLVLEGRMEDRNNGLQLSLFIRNNFTITYLGLTGKNIFNTVVLFIIVNRIFYVLFPMLSIDLSIFAWVTIPILFILAYYLQLKIISNYLDRMTKLYDDFLKNLESLAK